MDLESSIASKTWYARFAGRDDNLQLTEAERTRLRELGQWGPDGQGFLTWKELQTYRAALVLDGNTLADRLPFMLFTYRATQSRVTRIRKMGKN